MYCTIALECTVLYCTVALYCTVLLHIWHYTCSLLQHSCTLYNTFATLMLPGVLHLTQVNPQVPGASGSVPKQLLSQWHLPRVGSAMPQASTSQAPICGTSAFAFQGTNAHIIQEQGPLMSNYDRQLAALPVAWQRQRHWVAPPASTFVGSVMIAAAGSYRAGRKVVMEADLTTARSAFLREHRAMEHALFPAAGFVELCSNAAALMMHNKDVSGVP